MTLVQRIAFILFGYMFLYVKACRDENSMCAEYFKNDRVAGILCTHGRTKLWFQQNCKKSCNLCHLYTTMKPTTRTVPTRPTFPMKNCGQPSIPSSRVISGKNAIKGSWPWQIALHYKGRFLCGGSIVSPQWIVTAAHCVSMKQAKHFTVVVGEHNRSISEGTETTYNATQVLMHSSFTRPTRKANDIALIKVSKPILMNKYVQRVCLPEQWKEPAEGTKCYITGWGKMQHPGGPATILQQAPLKTVNTTTCKKLNHGLRVAIHGQTMLCAGNTNERNSGCHGDSGGPFVCQHGGGRWFLHGVVSWGSPTCNSKHGYSVFSKVSSNRFWLDRFIWY